LNKALETASAASSEALSQQRRLAVRALYAGRGGDADRLNSGDAFIWFMNGTTFTSSGSVSYVNSDWVIQGVGDYDGSGRAGILWRNSSTEQVYIWLMNRTTIGSTGSPGTPDAAWQIQP
jgi:hypothetical protein